MRQAALIWIPLALAIALVARRGLDVVAVRGRSMAPTLRPGDRLLVGRLHRSPRVGDVVLAQDPREPGRELIKRVASVDGDRIGLQGDNRSESSDVTVPRAAVRWRALARYWPLAHASVRFEPPPAGEPIDLGGEAACAFAEALVAGTGAKPT
jgi:signal peptidase I